MTKASALGEGRVYCCFDAMDLVLRHPLSHLCDRSQKPRPPIPDV